MQMNAWRMRMAALAVGVVVLGIYFLAGGSFAPKAVVQIEFGMYPEEFEGAEVVIDGEVRGTLKRFGNANRTGFEVSEGEHTIALRHPELPSQPLRFTGQPGMPLLLIADIQETYRGGRSRTEIVLNR